MTSGRLFIHVGLPKTGTTFMQEHVFPAFTGIKFLGKAKSVSIDDMLADDRRKYLMSSEHLLGCPFLIDGEWAATFRSNAVRLAERFPQARILLSLRKHEGLLSSYYKEHISKPNRPRYPTLPEYFDVENDKGMVRRQDLRFRDLVGHLERCFGRPPFVFFQEEIRDRFPALLADLAAYLDEPVPVLADGLAKKTVNPGVNYYQAKLLVLLNRLDSRMSRIRGLPTLHNRLFMRLGIQPDRLCRHYLRWLSDRPLEISEPQRSFIAANYREDWVAVNDYAHRVRSDLRREAA
jgi:hypothetical protein